MAYRILPLAATCKKVNKSRSSVYQGIKDGTFPRPIKLGLRSVGWIEGELGDWMRQRNESSRKQER